MAHLLHPWTLELYLRRRYLHQGALPPGEAPTCYARAVALRSAPGYALTVLVATEEGVGYGWLPLSALCTRPDSTERPLESLQPWDCFGPDFTAVELPGWPPAALCRLGDGSEVPGRYLLTVDWHSNPWSATPQQAKCAHLYELEDGNLCALPNNRLRLLDTSLIDCPFAPLTAVPQVQVHEWRAEPERALAGARLARTPE